MLLKYIISNGYCEEKCGRYDNEEINTIQCRQE